LMSCVTAYLEMHRSIDRLCAEITNFAETSEVVNADFDGAIDRGPLFWIVLGGPHKRFYTIRICRPKQIWGNGHEGDSS